MKKEDIRKILTGDDFGLFPEEMDTEFMALFRMQEIAGLREEQEVLRKQVLDLLLQNARLESEVAVKAAARKMTALWRIKHGEALGRAEKFRAALVDVGLSCSDAEVVRVVCGAFGIPVARFKSWRRAVKAKIERQKMLPSKRRRADAQE